MAVLVTGGAGYIGSHIVGALQDKAREVVVLDDMSTGKPQGVAKKNVVLQEGSVCDEGALARAFAQSKIDAVIHAAAIASVPAGEADPARCHEVNVHGTKLLMEAALAHNVRRAVFTSTSALYDASNAPPYEETSAVKPNNVYAATKWEAEKYLQKTAGMRSCVLRCFNVAGADPQARYGDRKKSATTLLKRALMVAQTEGEVLEIFGTDYATPDGTAVRDYIHVSDVAAAHVRALEFLETGDAAFEVFNLGTGRPVSVRELIEVVEKELGKPLKVKNSPRRKGDPAALCASAKKANEVLNWHPQHPELATMVKHAQAWEEKLKTK